MLYLSLFGLFLSTVVHAVPLDIEAPKDAVEWTPNFPLEADDVIDPIDGHCEFSRDTPESLKP